MKRSITPILVTLICLSCELVIDVDTPDFKPSIVANGIIQPDSTFRIFVSRDYYILDNKIDQYDQQGLTGAIVHLYEDDQLLGQMEETAVETDWGETFNGYYVFDQVPKEGSTYRIEIEKAGFPKAIAEQQIPSDIPRFSLAITDTLQNEWGSTNYRLEMKIQDLPGKNFYEVQLYVSTWEPYYFPEKDSLGYRPVIYNIYTYSEGILVSEYQDKFLFTDQLFSDTEYIYSFDVEGYFNYYYDGLNEPPGESYLIYQVRNCSEDYYNYYNSSALYFWNNDNPFAEPVHVYSNIENGYGIFGSFTARTDTLISY